MEKSGGRVPRGEGVATNKKINYKKGLRGQVDMSDKGVVEQGVLVVANGCSDYNALAAVQDLWLRLAKLTTDLHPLCEITKTVLNALKIH